MTTVRLAHFSDIHLTASPLGWRPRDLVGKRVTGWLNIKVLGRGRRFRDAPQVATALGRDLRGRNLDGAIFSGDATRLAFESEFAAAVAALDVGDPALPPVVAVPGNHDHYTRPAVAAGLFEKYFGPWLVGTRVGPEMYPFARRIGHVWLIGANSCTANRWHGDASGAFGADQLARLRELCASLDPGPRVLVTHYPLRTAGGQIEHRLHRLRDHAAALATAVGCGIDLWLHGHIHHGFILPPTPEIPFPVVCAGSTTQNNRWTYNEYAITGTHVAVLHRRYDPKADAFHDAGEFGFEMKAR
ncbi:metallophosphoesterase family protein [Fimbriiglobus ruber]|uniref:Phosphohydrolase n=1 Tax=Fimbriiglobus ruber TaxID=1908690 RepID=A0A225E1Q1_9BACT|nr:metallophosphoesterase [Fimbriiglobus ruber]OWK43409.1 phosphohydrolase [Fimbriiglobus ruber]